MSALVEGLTAYIANTTTSLSPLTLFTPVEPLSALITHITSTPVHTTYFPFLRFGAIHAARVSLIWAGMTSSRKSVPHLQDLFGYLVLCWGGGTIVSLLLGQAPSWLADPTPWLIYPPIHLLLVRTGIAGYMVQTAPGLINLFGAGIDALTRGTTITALPRALAASNLRTEDGGIWTTALMSGLAVASGGWVVQGLGMHEAEWKVGRPAVLSGGVLDTLDLWSGALTGVVYAALVRSHASLGGVSDVLERVVPGHMRAQKGKAGAAGAKGVVDAETARAMCVLVLGSLLAARVVVRMISAPRGKAPKSKVKAKQTPEEILAELTGEKTTAVVKNPVQPGSGAKVTPRKNKKHGSKSP